MRADGRGPPGRAMMSLSDPDMDFVRIGRGFGVPGVRVDKAEGLAAALAGAFATPGPHLIEAVMPPFDLAGLVAR